MIVLKHFFECCFIRWKGINGKLSTGFGYVTQAELVLLGDTNQRL